MVRRYHWAISVGIWLAIALTGCGGGGGGGSNSSTLPPTQAGPPATLKGVLQISAENMLEVEPNDSLTQAQWVEPGEFVSGYVRESDAGWKLETQGQSSTVHDLFKITTSRAGRIELRVGANDLKKNDIDLFLFSADGRVVNESVDVHEFEAVTVPAAGTYYFGVQAAAGESPYLLTLALDGTTADRTLSGQQVGAAFAPGQLLVKLNTGGGFPGSAPELPAIPGFMNGEQMRLSMGVDLMRLAPDNDFFAKMRKLRRLPDPQPSLATTLSALAALKRNPAVKVAEPDYIVSASRVPNDKEYGSQWHYEAISLPQAWEKTVGGGAYQVIVGVADTGVDSAHPDFKGKLLPGYDFIADPSIALDGDGRDSNPEDEGGGQRDRASVFHGTHVTGTIAAASDNGIGVAGVSWGAKIMPLRVLGKQGRGLVSDISEAILYAAGLSDISPQDKKVVDILNLSLGARGHSDVLADAVERARERGVIIVAAAGNWGDPRSDYPAAFPGVISVGALDRQLQLTSYSNYGKSLSLVAPGGSMSSYAADGVLSTYRRDDGEHTYDYLEGTSMATPHVAGVIALMKSVHPGLTPADVNQLIAGDHYVTKRRITRDLGAQGFDERYGHGIIDAALAVDVATELAGGTPVQGAVMSLSASALEFARGVTQSKFTLSNSGTGSLAIKSVRADQAWLSVSPAAGNAPMEVTVSVDRTGLSPGVYTGVVEVQGDGQPASASVKVTLKVPDESRKGDVGPVMVFAIDADTSLTKARTSTSASAGYQFTLEGLPAGRYIVVAGTDRDQDQTVCDMEDACGILRDPVTVTEGGSANVTLSVENLLRLRDTDPKPQMSVVQVSPGMRVTQ